MALIHKYTLLCDEVRQENNGKFLIVGLYTPDIVVPALPFAVSVLTFFNCLEADAPGTWGMSFRLTQGTTVLAGGSGKVGAQRDGLVVVPLRFGPIMFPAAGQYELAIDFEGTASITFTFSVILNVPQAPSAQSTQAIH